MALCGRGARIQHGEDNLVECARTREKIEILKDETQLAVSDISEGIAVEVRYRVPPPENNGPSSANPGSR